MRTTTVRGLGLLVAAIACGDTNPVEPAGTFYLSGTVTFAATGAPFEAEIELQQLGETVATTRTNAAGRYELTFFDTPVPREHRTHRRGLCLRRRLLPRVGRVAL